MTGKELNRQKRNKVARTKRQRQREWLLGSYGVQTPDALVSLLMERNKRGAAVKVKR